MGRNKVVIIFDLDETIGHFWQIGKLWEGLKTYEEKKFNKNDFYKLLDLHPFVFRPKIFEIFKYLKRVKEKDKNVKVIIYSNNMGTPKWANMIKTYIEKKINYKLFDEVITAWKVNGIIYEKCRTTNEKTYKEILKCGNLNKNTKIFFVDDAHHPKMYHKNVEYLHIKDWKFKYDINKMINNFLRKCEKKISNKKIEELKTNLPKFIKDQNWGYIRYRNSNTPNTEEINRGKKLMTSIMDFLKKNNKKSRNKRRRKSRFTRRN